MVRPPHLIDVWCYWWSLYDCVGVLVAILNELGSLWCCWLRRSWPGQRLVPEAAWDNHVLLGVDFWCWRCRILCRRWPLLVVLFHDVHLEDNGVDVVVRRSCPDCDFAAQTNRKDVEVAWVRSMLLPISCRSCCSKPFVEEVVVDADVVEEMLVVYPTLAQLQQVDVCCHQHCCSNCAQNCLQHCDQKSVAILAIVALTNNVLNNVVVFVAMLLINFMLSTQSIICIQSMSSKLGLSRMVLRIWAWCKRMLMINLLCLIVLLLIFPTVLLSVLLMSLL